MLRTYERVVFNQCRALWWPNLARLQPIQGDWQDDMVNWWAEEAWANESRQDVL